MSLKSFLETVDSIIVNNLRLIHLNLQGMNLGSDILNIIEKIASSRSLNSVHLSDNNLAQEIVKIVYQKMGVADAYGYYFKSAEEEMVFQGAENLDL